MIVEEAVTRRGFKKVAILADSTNRGQPGRRTWRSAEGQRRHAGRGREVQHQGRRHDGLYLKAREAGAQTVLTYGIDHGPPDRDGINAGLGVTTGNSNIYIGHPGNAGESFAIRTSGLPQTFIQEPTNPKRQSFIISYLKTFNPKNARIDSPVSAAQGSTPYTCSRRRSSKPAPQTDRRSKRLWKI